MHVLQPSVYLFQTGHLLPRCLHALGFWLVALVHKPLARFDKFLLVDAFDGALLSEGIGAWERNIIFSL